MGTEGKTKITSLARSVHMSSRLAVRPDEVPGIHASAVLDALPDRSVIVDRIGVIRFANSAWDEFAGVSGGSLDKVSVGANYLDACVRSVHDGCDEAEEAIRCIRRVLAGEVEQCLLEYECSSPTDRRWFVLRASQLRGPDGVWVLASHLDITARRRAYRAARALALPADEGDLGVLTLPALRALTEAERQVVVALLRGQNVARIAELTFVSRSTVRSQLSTAFRKLGVASQMELVELVRAALWGSD